MRVLLDANLFISYLLTPNGDSPPVVILERAFAGEFTLLLVKPLLDELVRDVATKPYLAQRITSDDLAALIDALYAIAEPVAEITERIPRLCRDPNDDYLLAHAAVAGADYLVSGDRDLLVLDPLKSPRILALTEFIVLLGGLA